MSGRRWGFAVACLAVIGATVAVAGGSAGNRDAEFAFDAVPGPSRVTYGEKIAYRATFTNLGSTFTQIEFRMRVPFAEFGSQPYPQATFAASNCPSTPAIVSTPGGPEWVCQFGKLTPGTPGTPQLVLTVLWNVPTLASSSTCVDCLKTNGYWTIKEGKPTNANETFPSGGKNVAATLLPADGNDEAGGYETGACTSPLGAGSLTTNQAVGPANLVSTTVCLPFVPTNATNFGLATTILEGPDGATVIGAPQFGKSDVCIAALGGSCSGSFTPANFSPQVVTFVFRVYRPVEEDNDPVGGSGGGGGTGPLRVFHEGVELGACPSTNPLGCWTSKTEQGSVATIVAQASTNGRWDVP